MIVDGFKKENVDRAAELIRTGHIVAFPTETVYGLGADAFNEGALKKIFEAKQRPYDDPLILHIADRRQLDDIVSAVPPKAHPLIEKFWPGPLTLIFEKKSSVPALVNAGLDTVAVRMPRHPVALSLIRAAKCIIAAPSANRFQCLSPTTAEAVRKELGNKVPLILDGGPCQVGLESTVLSLTDGPRILRTGGVSVEEIERVLGEKVKLGQGIEERSGQAAPGQMKFHYAPRKPLKFFNIQSLQDFAREAGSQNVLKDAALVCFSSGEEKIFQKAGFKDIFVLSPQGDGNEAAQRFFSLLRDLDEGKWKSIVALECPEEGLGRAINERLKKAQHG